MEEYRIAVRKLTDDTLMREACEMTFLGQSRQTLSSIYRSEHSPARTQLFWVTAHGIPLFVATHLLRHHVGSVPYQLTCRNDRQGGNIGFEERMRRLSTELEQGEASPAAVAQELRWLQTHADRRTRVNLGLLINAQSLIDMAKVRLCHQAHVETRIIMRLLKAEVKRVDPALVSYMVPKCVYRGGLCGEPRCCGYNHTKPFEQEMRAYLKNYSTHQQGTFNPNQL